MKKLSLMLGSLLFVSGVVYGKEVVVAPVEMVTETVYVAVTPEPVTNIYGKIGLDVWSEYDKSTYGGLKLTDGDTDSLGFEVALEVTRNITKNLELGLGIAYQRHSDYDTYSVFDGNMGGKIEFDRYDSVPVYVVGKYNFEQYSNGLKPYLKAVTGVSFNFDKGDVKIKTDSNINEKINMDIENGLYFGIGGGIEYNDFFVDLMYQVNTAEAELKINDLRIEEMWETDVDYSRITLGFGYKFSY